eukprot:6179982-Pleurochrysis_carterae.AAC.2
MLPAQKPERCERRAPALRMTETSSQKPMRIGCGQTSHAYEKDHTCDRSAGACARAPDTIKDNHKL